VSTGLSTGLRNKRSVSCNADTIIDGLRDQGKLPVSVVGSQWEKRVLPSSIVSKAGSIGLSWEDRKGNSIEVTISGNLIDYFTERDGREESVTVDRVQELAHTLSSL